MLQDSELIEALGGGVAVSDLILKSRKKTVHPVTVRMWKNRNSIPQKWRITMGVLADAAGLEWNSQNG